MIRLLSGAIAAALAAAPVVIMPEPPVAVTARSPDCSSRTVAIAARWRWPATAAAAVFLVDYTAALWLADARVSIAGAAGFGLALLYLLESLDLAGRVHRATVDTAVIRSHLGRWTGFGAATLGAAGSARGRGQRPRGADAARRRPDPRRGGRARCRRDHRRLRDTRRRAPSTPARAVARLSDARRYPTYARFSSSMSIFFI